MSPWLLVPAVLGPVSIVLLQTSLQFFALPSAALLLWTLIMTRFAGRRAGLVTLAVSVPLSNWMLMPVGRFSLSTLSACSMALFLLFGAIIVLVVGRMRDRLAANQTTVASLERDLQRRDEFVAIAGHELKTPLTALWLRVQSWQRALAREKKIGRERSKQNSRPARAAFSV